MSDQEVKAKFNPGEIVMTRGIQAILPKIDLIPLLRRHVSGDWGDCGEEDAAASDEALITGTRLLSVYKTTASPEGKIWVITEADRSATTFLLPSEY